MDDYEERLIPFELRMDPFELAEGPFEPGAADNVSCQTEEGDLSNVSGEELVVCHQQSIFR